MCVCVFVSWVSASVEQTHTKCPHLLQEENKGNVILKTWELLKGMYFYTRGKPPPICWLRQVSSSAYFLAAERCLKVLPPLHNQEFKKQSRENLFLDQTAQNHPENRLLLQTRGVRKGKEHWVLQFVIFVPCHQGWKHHKVFIWASFSYSLWVNLF